MISWRFKMFGLVQLEWEMPVSVCNVYECPTNVLFFVFVLKWIYMPFNMERVASAILTDWHINRNGCGRLVCWSDPRSLHCYSNSYSYMHGHGHGHGMAWMCYCITQIDIRKEYATKWIIVGAACITFHASN